MTEYWFVDHDTGFKTMFMANSEEQAKEKWDKYSRTAKCLRIGDLDGINRMR